MTDPEAHAHQGMLHAALGTSGQADALQQAHHGFVAQIDPNAPTLDETFAIVIEDDDTFSLH